ncbi:MAG: NFACT family protein [Candidatus Aenigmarchaeota archaeon]|nr:NFACT family protein [Candidatus Aenigmarchaeota archaeon]
MKTLNSLEILFLVRSLRKDLVSSKIQKVKQISEKAFSLELYKEKKHNYLIFSNETLFLSNKSYESKSLTNLGQVLRKRLTNQIIQDMKQHEFDRIVELETEDYLLIVELFDKGNIILANKPDKKIIIASRMRSWKDRSIKPKMEYKYPPSKLNPFNQSFYEFVSQFGSKKVVSVLAIDLGFGGEIAEEICKRAKIDKDSVEVDASKLYDFVKKIDKEFKEQEDINEKLRKEFEQGLEKEGVETKKIDKLERIRKVQEEALKKWQEKEIEYRKIGKLLYERYEKVKEQLDSGMKKIKIDNIIIDVDPKKSVQKNAEIYFEMAKKAKKKIEGIRRAMKESEKKKLILKKREPIKEIRREWYDKFRWFISSDGFLVVAGKDAKTNEQLIRKYMKPNDLVFHTDITGSPFVLIKNPDEKIPSQTILEAAEFCGSYSKAWKVGISAVDVYYIKPDQVKKEGGLPTGSFMICGKREWIRRIPVKIAIGVDDKTYYGPEDMVKRKTSKYVIVIPGDTPAHEIGKKIREKFKTKVEVEGIIPYGRGQLLE